MSLKKTLVGLAPLSAASDLDSAAMTQAALGLGGLVEFMQPGAYGLDTDRINARPDYPKLRKLWWMRRIGQQ